MSKLYNSLVVFVLCIVSCSTVFAESVTLSGECVGVKVYTDGLIITNTEKLTDTEGKAHDIARGYGIKKGDIIKKVNGTDATSSKVITDAVAQGKGVALTILRDGREQTINVEPIKTQQGFKLGLWLRDSTAGMGTITCIKDGKFIALGHGICDIDTGDIMPVKNGIIQRCTNIEIIKGSPGHPGAIKGDIDDLVLGSVLGNFKSGLYGTINCGGKNPSVEVAKPSEVKRGDAFLISNIDGTGIRQYEIKIKRIALTGGSTKDMTVEITDKELLEKTGGIIQGM